MATQDDLICAEDCDGVVPIVDNSPCAPAIKYGEIAYLVIGNEGQPLTNWTDPAEVSARLDNDDDADPAALRILQVVGTMTTEFGEQKPIHGGLFSFGKNTTTVEAKVFNNSETNYDFIRALSCNLGFRFWPITSDGQWYGGNEGISVVLQGKEDVPESRDDFRVLTVRGQFKSNRTQLRTDFPLAFDDINQ